MDALFAGALAFSVMRAAFGAELAHPTRIYLDGGEDDAELRRTLEVELPGTLVTSTAAASLRLVVRRSPDALVVELEDTAGQNATRRFSYTETVQPALRRVVLLAARAQQALSDVFEERDPDPVRVEAKVEPPSEAVARTIAVEAGWSLVWWRTPFKPELGPTVAAVLSIDRFDLGLRMVIGGVPSYTRTASGISGDAIEAAGIAEAGLMLAALGPLEVRARLGAGVNWVRIDVSADGLPGAQPQNPQPFTVQRFSRVEPIFRAAPSLRLVIWPNVALLWAEGGVEARLLRLQVAPPSVGIYRTDTLDSGGLVPFFEGGLGVMF
jgi:hypothetical protein